ncbi:MAG: hypothetical protein R6X20_01210 [Phycisphaerae bacterium]
MSDSAHPYTDEAGRSLFGVVLDLYDEWLAGIPYLSERGDAINAMTRSRLVHDVWPAVERLCVRLEAHGQGELASRLERAFRDAEDYGRLLDNWCESQEFDYHLWAYGDPALDGLHYSDADLESLEAEAFEIGEGPLTEDLAFWQHERQWAREVGERAEQVEVEKFPRAPSDDYALRTEVRAWASFWLAAQLAHRGIDHRRARDVLEGYLSSVGTEDKAKQLIRHEALGRAYGMQIHPLPPLESEEVAQALEGFTEVVFQIRNALAAGQPTEPAPASEGPAPEDDLHFFPPIHFLSEWEISGDALRSARRRDVIRVRRLPMSPGQKQPRYAYCEEDARRLWPHKFPPADEA